MNAREGVDMVKMAIAVLILVLLIGAVLTVWYLMQDTTVESVAKMEKAANSSTAERMYELSDYTNSNNETVAVPTVVNALSEFTEGDLVFIMNVVHKDDGSISKDLYTYKDLQQNVDIQNVEAGVTWHNDSNLPINTACKQLLLHSKQECKVTVNDIETSNGTMIGVIIEVFN